MTMTIAEAYRILALPAYAQNNLPKRAIAQAEREAEQRMREYVSFATLDQLDYYRNLGESGNHEGTNHAYLAYIMGLRAEVLSIILSEHETLVEGVA